MKKNLKFFVWAISALVISMFASCDSFDAELKDIVKPAEVKELSCAVIENSYTGNGVVATRSTDYNGTPDGTFFATSKHKATFEYGEKLIERTYIGINKAKAFRVKKPRYARSLDIFNKASFVENQALADGRLSYTVRFGGSDRTFDFDIIEETVYDTDTLIVMGKTFKKCKNFFVDRKLDGDPIVTDLQRDSADWHAYRLQLNFRYTLEEGSNNIGLFSVTIPQLWIAKQGTNPDIPDDKPEIVMFEDKDFGFDFVNDTLSNSYFTLINVYSDGTKGNGKKISVNLINKLIAPEKQEKLVSNLSWTAAQASAASAVKNGALYEKSKNIFVQPYKQLYTTRTNKCDAVFTATYEGSAYYVDSLGKAHQFIDKQWSFEDKDWTGKDLEATAEHNRVLLTSSIQGSFNAHAHNAKAEVELKARKDGSAEILKYEYEAFGIKSVSPLKTYNTFCEQYAVYGDGSREKVGTLSVNIDMNTVSPEKQMLTVSDFNISDQKATESNAISSSNREVKLETGTFKIRKVYKNYTTNTNKSDCKFVTYYEDVVVFVDNFGKETTFKGIEPSFTDNGSTIEALTEQDEMDRKLLTSKISVKVLNDSEDYSGQVEFRKAKEVTPPDPTEELTDWSKTQTLEYVGNSTWKSTTVLTYNYKLAGPQSETVEQLLTWGITGEEKKQIILTEAKADYKSMSSGSETSSSSTNGNITIVTKTKTITENYTTLSDLYTQTTQTASYSKEVLGKTVSFNFLAPTAITVAHVSGALTATNTTKTVNSIVYDVYNHTGSISYDVDGKTGSVTDEKDVLVKHEETPVEPYNPAWGNVVGLAGATLVYRPNAGESGNGVFHKCLVINFEKGKLIVVTASYGPNAYDFTFDENDFYAYGDQIEESYKINSAALFNGRWVPALITLDGTGWKYGDIYGHIVQMDQRAALACGIKNFSGQNTAENNPFLNYVGMVSADNVLTVKNHVGATVFTIK